jgi:hypothetical protein
MKKTSPLTIAFAFLVIAIPLGWGFYRSVKNSMPLFTANKAAVAAPVPPAAAAK